MTLWRGEKGELGGRLPDISFDHSRKEDAAGVGAEECSDSLTFSLHATQKGGGDRRGW